MHVSPKDPFMNKQKRIWKNFHKAVASTNEIMESLEPYETRKQTKTQYMQRFIDQDKRYYRVEKKIEPIKEIN